MQNGSYIYSNGSTGGKIPAVIGGNRFLHIPLSAIAPEPGSVPALMKALAGWQATKHNH
jgi:hypothetical protein